MLRIWQQSPIKGMAGHGLQLHKPGEHMASRTGQRQLLRRNGQHKTGRQLTDSRMIAPHSTRSIASCSCRQPSHKIHIEAPALGVFYCESIQTSNRIQSHATNGAYGQKLLHNPSKQELCPSGMLHLRTCSSPNSMLNLLRESLLRGA